MTPRAEEERDEERAVIRTDDTRPIIRMNDARLIIPTTNGTNREETNETRPVIRATNNTIQGGEGRRAFHYDPDDEPLLPLAPPRPSAGKFCSPKDGEQEFDGTTGKKLHAFSRTSISSDLARKLKAKAAFLDISLRSVKLGGQNMRAIGAAALLEFKEHDGQTRKLLVTAKHYVYKDTKEEEETFSIVLKTQSPGRVGQLFDPRFFRIDSRAAGPIDLRTNDEGTMVEWDHGNDVLTLPLEYFSDLVLDVLHAFEMVRNDFECKVGQKVGIITWNDKEGASLDSVKADTAMDLTEIRKHFGRPDDVNIYTGEIKVVGSQHIEHDTNTYSGCSGSLIFLLDNDQPDSVQEEDHGKVIAIHVGSKDDLPYNIGLKLVGTGVKPLTSYAETF